MQPELKIFSLLSGNIESRSVHIPK